MNKDLTTYQQSLSRRIMSALLSPLLMSVVCGYVFVATGVAFYLAQEKQYESEFAVVLPGSGASSKVILEEVGQVSSSTPSAFGHQHNPRSNYKAILLSTSLKASVTDRLGLSIELNRPKISLLEQTSIIGLTTKAGSPKQAQRLAWAYFDAFQEELDRLRADENLRRDAGIERVLDNYRNRLDQTRRAIIEFQQRSLLVSQQQLEHHIRTLASVREQLTFARSESKSLQNSIHHLSSDLGVSTKLAAHALNLQSDTRFAGYVRELGVTTAQLSQYRSQWGASHPKVVAERQRYATARANLRKRSGEVVGIHAAEVLGGMNLSASANLAELFAGLLNDGAKLHGLNAKINDLSLADQRLEDQLRVYSRESAELERLEREHQRAEAIYSSAAARLETSQADIFSSYPVVQLLTPPSLSTEHDSPRNIIAVAAGLSGFLLISIAGLILWQRQAILRALLKKS